VKETKLKVARMLTKFHLPCWLTFLLDTELDSIPEALSWFQAPGVGHLDRKCWEQTKGDIASGARDKLEGSRAETRESGRVASFIDYRRLRLQ